MTAVPAGARRAAATCCRPHLRLLLLAASVLLSLPVSHACGADVLVTGAYIETSALKRFARSFRTPHVLAICNDALVVQALKSKVTQCERERCPPDGCAPGQCDSPKSGWRELAYYPDCGASAFLLGIAGLRAGPIQAARADERNRVYGHMQGEGFRFRFLGADYLVRTVMTNEGSPGSRARLEILRNGKPYATPLGVDAHDMTCGVNWMGDVNGDGAPDLVVACTRSIYERIGGLFLSRKEKTGAFEFVRQRETGGVL